MTQLSEEIFVCIDCEATGLDPVRDRIVEVAATQFTFQKTLVSFESLVNPECEIPRTSQEIHNISAEMLQGKPKVKEVLPKLFQIMDHHLIVGHGVPFDIALITHEAERVGLSLPVKDPPCLDTLRLARLYGDSPTNSLEQLRSHFNIPAEGAHRAMSDVTVNIEVFKHLARRYSTLQELVQALRKPILLKIMPLGKYKGRRFEEVPLEYLLWAERKNFDGDLLFSIRSELSIRRRGKRFGQASNPFSSMDL